MDQILSRQFGAVFRYYRKLHASREIEGSGLYRLTSRGAWATSRAPHVFNFFRKIELSQYNLFIDLGSGDGIVACVAGLFTRSIGIEADPELSLAAQNAAKALDLTGSTSFVCADYLTQKISVADCLYIYPDKPFYPLEELLSNWRGTLLVYGPHIPPRRMHPKAKLQCGRERITLYSEQ